MLQYYIENNHPPIIRPEIFEMVQKEMKERLDKKGRYSGVDKFSAKIKCGLCRGLFGAKVWHSNDKYRRVIYQCNNKFKGGQKCCAPHLDINQIEQMFISAVNQLITDKEDIIANLEITQTVLCNNKELETEEHQIREEMAVLTEMADNYIAENARTAINQDEYRKRYDSIAERYDRAKEKLDKVMIAIADNKARKETIRHFIQELKRQDDIITEFDETLWGSLVDYITVYSKDDIRFTFRDGTEIRI